MPAPLAYVVEAIHCGTPLFHASTCPPTPVPKKVEVATNVGAPVAPVALASTVLAPAVLAYEVELPTEVMTPVRLALVVTVLAFPVMERLIGVEVLMEAKVFTPVA